MRMPTTNITANKTAYSSTPNPNSFTIAIAYIEYTTAGGM